MSERLLFVYADESCLGNQHRTRARPGAAGGLLEYYDPERGWKRRDFWVAEADTTNNRMAITSAIAALGALKRPSRVVFTSDSRYLIDGATQWVHGWAARGWTRKGGEIENLPLWHELLIATAPHQIHWRWVKGHAGHPQNEYANHLATRGAADQTSSGGLVPSHFEQWLAAEQARKRCTSFSAAAPPQIEFRPARPLPAL